MDKSGTHEAVCIGTERHEIDADMEWLGKTISLDVNWRRVSTVLRPQKKAKN